MEKSNDNFFVRRKRAFGHAGRGLRLLAANEVHFRIHLFAFVLVMLAGWWVGLSTTEWLIIVIVSGLVFSAEAFNSVMERLCDFVSPEYHARIKDIKDMSAAAVTLAAITAFVAGLIIFIPKIIFPLFS
ncbi:undecaprenol kinase [Prolixibacter bellariivorans]|uniref:Undecaprenol kinase n=1 Tax=Prolixibacter bellariivorans TaxID=314319 RepID=A0A5M4B1D1_9BACT|nr:diacylglycerol kinase family protein [Prolixibacter bellariivorans]GET33711.1 undecaprenol kinase [Prolixibacter bellariivorans]